MPPSSPAPAESPGGALAAEAARLRRARRSVGAVFALHGAVSGSFATRIPWLKDHLELGTAELGVALVFPALGAAIAMPLAGGVMHRFGGRAAVRGMIALWCLALGLPALAPTMVALWALLLVFGASAGMCDVAMNAQGVEVERRYGRSIMSGLHGLWSVGTLLASAAGVAAVGLGIDARLHLGVAAVALCAAVPAACRGLLGVRPEPDADPPPRFALPPRAALLVGAVGMCAFLAEMASMDWSGVYLRELAGASEAVAAASTTAFVCTMAIARLLGDVVVSRLGPVRTVRLGGALAMAGGVLVTTARVPAQGIAGFALLGVGIAVVLPLAFAAAGRSGPNAAQAIAGVATVTYVTGLVAPTLVGTLGELTSLRISFAVVAAALAMMTLGAGVLGRAEPPPAVARGGATGPAHDATGARGEHGSPGGGHPTHGGGEQLG